METSEKRIPRLELILDRVHELLSGIPRGRKLTGDEMELSALTSHLMVNRNWTALSSVRPGDEATGKPSRVKRLGWEASELLEAAKIIGEFLEQHPDAEIADRSELNEIVDWLGSQERLNLKLGAFIYSETTFYGLQSTARIHEELIDTYASLEAGDATLDEALELFDRLAREAQERLEEVEDTLPKARVREARSHLKSIVAFIDELWVDKLLRDNPTS